MEKPTNSKLSWVGYTPTDEQMLEAFENNKNRSGERVSFIPEVKVKRETDTLYIHEIKRIKDRLVVVVEVFHPSTGSDKAPMPIRALSDTAQRAIYTRLSTNQSSLNNQKK